MRLFWCLNDVYSDLPDTDSPELETSSTFNQIVNFFRRNSKLYYFLKKNFSDRPKSYYLYDEKFYQPDNIYFKKSLKQLIVIKEILSSKDIKFTVTLLPYEYQLRKTIQDFNPQKLLRGKLKENEIHVIDLSRKFNALSISPDNFYLYGDGIHFSDKGHKIISQFLLQNYFNLHGNK